MHPSFGRLLYVVSKGILESKQHARWIMTDPNGMAAGGASEHGLHFSAAAREGSCRRRPVELATKLIGSDRRHVTLESSESVGTSNTSALV